MFLFSDDIKSAKLYKSPPGQGCRVMWSCRGYILLAQLRKLRCDKSLSSCFSCCLGNGPSGISLSYLLAGNWPYHTGEIHPNEYLQLRLQDGGDKSLIEQVQLLTHRWGGGCGIQMSLSSTSTFTHIMAVVNKSKGFWFVCSLWWNRYGY